MDKVRAVHKVIGTIIESAEPGWREDGLYSYDWGDGLRALDWIKVKTKKGALRKEPRGAFRYDGADGHLARQVTIRLFESSADVGVDAVPLEDREVRPGSPAPALV